MYLYKEIPRFLFFFFFSRVWKFMNVSLSIIWCSASKEICSLLHIFLIVRIWALWSDGHLLWEMQNLNIFYCYAQIYYHWHYLSYFEFLFQNLLCAADCMLFIMRLGFFFFFGCFQSDNLCLCLQKLKTPL